MLLTKLFAMDYCIMKYGVPDGTLLCGDGFIDVWISFLSVTFSYLGYERCQKDYLKPVLIKANDPAKEFVNSR